MSENHSEPGSEQGAGGQDAADGYDPAVIRGAEGGGAAATAPQTSAPQSAVPQGTRPQGVASKFADALLYGVLGDIIIDIIKPESGWDVYVQKVGEILSSVPFLQLATHRGLNPEEPAAAQEYGNWIHSSVVLLASAHLNRSALKEIADRLDSTMEEVAELIARFLLDETRFRKDADYDFLDSFIEAYLFAQVLDRTLPPREANRIRALRRKI
ncbi:hypothetical protein [Massilia sp. METH4]|uniref:hypothetical protein n=1 Tax=Massilia sp. METH4 TaxID=3123041 RepID=UPI0030CAE938